MSDGLYMGKGRFATIDGPDLSGKSTFSHSIADALKVFGVRVLWTTEPWYDVPSGEAIRKYLLGDYSYPIDPLQFQELFKVNRAEHLNYVINPALARGEFVVCDRYISSSIVYGKADGVSEELLWKLNDLFPIPELVFVLQVSDVEARRRASERGQTQRLSKWDQDPEFQERVRKNYWELCRHKADKICRDPRNVVMLNGEESREEIQRQAAEHLLGLTSAR